MNRVGTYMKNRQPKDGFTIVELLIVVVVIAILAAITIVSYNGISDRASQAAIQSEVQDVTKKLLLYAADNSDVYPPNLSDIGIKSDSETTYQYTPGTGTFYLTGSSSKYSYNTSATQTSPTLGIYPGHSFVVWNKFKNAATTPLPTATQDSSVFRTTAPSLRIGPSTTGVAIRGTPLTVTTGETYRVSFWLQTDSPWDGTSNNSKVRYGSGGNPVATCNYNGVKLTWSYVTCPYTVTAGVTSLTISVGNDGTTGNIWIDDLSLSRQ